VRRRLPDGGVVNDTHLWDAYDAAAPDDRPAAAGAIVEYHIRFFHHLANAQRFRTWPEDLRDELFQDLCARALELVPRYDRARQVPFVNFVAHSTRNARWDVEVRRRAFTVTRHVVTEIALAELNDRRCSVPAADRATLRAVVSGDTTVWNEAPTGGDPAELVCAADHDDRRNALVRTLLDGEFTALERDLLTERLMVARAERTMLRRIAERHGCSGEWCRKVEVRLLERLREAASQHDGSVSQHRVTERHSKGVRPGQRSHPVATVPGTNGVPA
jgi:hypothetical protein